MLAEGRKLAAAGSGVVVGLVETHDRRELDDIAAGLKVLPRRSIAYRGTSFDELDTDAVLACHPDVVLVDVEQREFVPDEGLLAAARVDFVDVPPQVVLQRLNQQRAGPAGGGFFDPGRMEA